MPFTTLHKLGRVALGALALPLVAACWSDVNKAQDGSDTATAFDSAGIPAQAAPAQPPMDTLAPPIDTAARADSLARSRRGDTTRSPSDTTRPPGD